MDRRAVNALTLARASQRERLTAELRRNGYDPTTLEELPDPGACDCALARAIRDWQDVNQQLEAAEQRQSGWRN